MGGAAVETKSNLAKLGLVNSSVWFSRQLTPSRHETNLGSAAPCARDITTRAGFVAHAGSDTRGHSDHRSEPGRRTGDARTAAPVTRTSA